jgi:DNA repair protein RAD51
MIQTGIQKLDELLGGGIRHGIITDIFGASATGKTQLALQICINALKNDVEILYQDTTGGFRPERMLTLIKTKNMDSKILDHVKVGRITNISEQIKYLEKISEIKNLGLIVIDNVTDLFSFEYSKESNLLEKHIVFMEYMHNLAFIAIKKKIPIIVTNIVRKSDDIERENLDRSISMYTHQKIYLTKVNQKYAAQIFPSFGHKKEIHYMITSAGLVDSP